jgi:hypothetical protein
MCMRLHVAGGILGGLGCVARRCVTEFWPENQQNGSFIRDVAAKALIMG